MMTHIFMQNTTGEQKSPSTVRLIKQEGTPVLQLSL